MPYRGQWKGKAQQVLKLSGKGCGEKWKGDSVFRYEVGEQELK